MEAQLQEDPSKALLRWIAKLGAAVVATLGLTGIVSLIGAAVLYERFEQAGLPATQALAAVPDEQLTIEGAAGLIAVLLIASVVVMVLFSLDRTGQITRATAITLALMWLGGVIWVICGTNINGKTVLLLAALGAVLALASIGVGRVTGALFVPFAAAVFVSTVVFGGTVNFAIAAEQKFIQPAAVLREEGCGLRGFYVADTDEHVYLAVLRRERGEDPAPGDTIPLFRFPREDTTRVHIGELLPYDEALDVSTELREGLTEREDPKEDCDPISQPPPP
jgi:hypothetical protein